MNVGFIGLGSMGFAIAQNLLKAGHTLTVYNRTASKAESLRQQGARVAQNPGEACGGDVVFTMLADDAALSAIFDDGKLLDRFGAGTIHVSMSTISLALAEKLTAMHREAGKAFVSAPVFGRPDAAAAAKLFIVAAGSTDLLEQCQPLFSIVGQKTFPIGEKPPQANVVKLCGNFMIGSVIESLGEAMALSRKAGIDPQQFLDVMTGSLFSAPVYKNYGAMIAKGQYEPAGFKLALGLKDIRLALAASDELRVPLPLGGLIRDHLISALAQGMENYDWAGFAAVITKNAGL